MRVLIHGGLVVDPGNRICSRQDLLLEDGKVAGSPPPGAGAELRIDASGKVVCPGFVDIHMHEDPPDNGGSSILHSMLRMGVTTAIGGNCGINTAHPADYLDRMDRGAPVNVGMLAGHAFFRAAAGCEDRYAPATGEQIEKMAAMIGEALDRGCLGLSFGIRYTPGATPAEFRATAAACAPARKLVTAHIRDDAANVFDAAREFLDAAKEAGVPAQLSHIGSMAGFGQMAAFLQLVDRYRLDGLDVGCDCYPYYAFSTMIGAATYDDGWLERYGCGYDAVELCEGEYRGRRCTREIFEAERRDHPGYLTVCYVMQEADVDLAFRHPGVMVGSDGLLSAGRGHPRAAGTFPRVFAEFVRKGKLDLYSAVERMTAMPAARLGLSRKGRFSPGADADVVIFDPETIRDAATFETPLSPPEGLDYVLLGGEVALDHGKIVRNDLGRSVRA